MIGPAIKNLRPTSTFSVGDTYDTLNWLDNFTPPPTEEEVAAEVARLANQWTNTEYQRLRATEYPPMADQLDMIFHGGLEAWKSEIQAVKDKYPKP